MSMHANSSILPFGYIIERYKQLPIREAESTNNILGTADCLPIDQLVS